MAQEPTEKELLEFKKRADEAKQRQSQLQGQLNTLMKQLKDKYSCSTVKEGWKEVDNIEEEKAQYRKSREEGIQKLEEEYSILWDEQ